MGLDPEAPDALFRRPSDYRYFLGFTGGTYGIKTGRQCYGSHKSLECLRTKRFIRCQIGDTVYADEAAQQRANEIVAANEACEAEIMARRDTANLHGGDRGERPRVRALHTHA